MRSREMRARICRRLLWAAMTAVVGLVLGGCRDEPPPVTVTTDSAIAAHPVAFDPPQGATDVDPTRTSLSVTFDRTMDPQGWAWVIEGAMTAPELGASSWGPENRTNTVEAKLEPGRDYVVWVNSPQYLYFKDLRGKPAAPTRWTFSTRGAGDAAVSEVSGMIRSTPQGSPRVVRFAPANGAVDVDPSTTTLRATFDREMQESWSWVTEGESFPQTTGDAYFESDRRTAVLPVRLEPGREYVVWLNSEQYRLFRDEAGAPAEPARWTFTTGPAR